MVSFRGMASGETISKRRWRSGPRQGGQLEHEATGRLGGGGSQTDQAESQGSQRKPRVH